MNDKPKPYEDWVTSETESEKEIRKWYINVAQPCKCKPETGIFAGVCRLVGTICDHIVCPFRLHNGKGMKT